MAGQHPRVDNLLTPAAGKLSCTARCTPGTLRLQFTRGRRRLAAAKPRNRSRRSRNRSRSGRLSKTEDRMDHATYTSEDHHVTPVWQGIPTPKFGIWLFLVSEIMFFSGLIVAYLSSRNNAHEWPVAAQALSVPLVAFNTFLLIFSSVTMVFAYDSAERGNLRR